MCIATIGWMQSVHGEEVKNCNVEGQSFQCAKLKEADAFIPGGRDEVLCSICMNMLVGHYVAIFCAYNLLHQMGH